jgi:hypothetical protein
MKSSARIALAGSLALLALAGCSSSSSSTGSASASVVGGMTECTDQAVGDAINTALEPEGAKLISLDKLDCADGWAVAQVVTGTDDVNSQTGDVEVLQAEGQFWVLQDRTAVCGKVSEGATAAPSDATIPAALWVAGCTTD